MRLSNYRNALVSHESLLKDTNMKSCICLEYEQQSKQNLLSHMAVIYLIIKIPKISPRNSVCKKLTYLESNQSILKEISPEYHWKDWCWSWSSKSLAMWCEEPTHWKRSWCWERLKSGEKGTTENEMVWMASPTQQTWVWASSGSWWWTGKPGVLQSMGSQRVRHDWGLNNNKARRVSILIYLFKIFCFLGFLRWEGGEGNGSPLQYSYLENPMDGGAW